MLSATGQAELFVVSIAAVSAAIGLILRKLSRRRRWPSIDVPDVLSLEDAAKFAQRQTAAEDLPLARVINRGNSITAAIAWFAHSISKWIPVGSTTVTRKQLRRYLLWARAVQ